VFSSIIAGERPGRGKEIMLSALRLGRLGCCITLAVLFASLLATPAAGTLGCSYNPGTRTVNLFILESVGTATIYVAADEQIKARFDATPHDCNATTSQALHFNIDGSGGADVFQIDQGGPGGNFPHSRDWDVDMSTEIDMGSVDVVRVLGRPVTDRVYVNKLSQGTATVDVIDSNGDGTVNVFLQEVERVGIRSLGGNDRIGVSGSAYGALGALEPARLPLTLKSGSGNDELTGGIKSDTEVAGPGNDDLSGGAGPDLLKGQGGSDRLNGNAGSDTCNGGPGADTLIACEH
jgi:Ca2+-binding RTX toxin-like protein